jgi:hypothetical protein
MDNERAKGKQVAGASSSMTSGSSSIILAEIVAVVVLVCSHNSFLRENLIKYLIFFLQVLEVHHRYTGSK